MSNIDWTKSMIQTFEYYEVDPNTWKDIKLIENIKSCSIKRDLGAETLSSASINIINQLGECYIRCYLIVEQDKIKYKFPLGTFLVQTPSSVFDGKVRNVTMDAYSPLLELKEKSPSLGYSLLKDDNIMSEAYMITREKCRAPVVETTSNELLRSNFVSNTSDTWLNFLSDLIGQANYHFYLDEEGKILFSPDQKIEELQPVWTFNDDNSSILYPELDFTHDLYGVPNVVEVVCSNGTDIHYSRAVNDDPNSPTSTINRKREIIFRDTEPNLPQFPTNQQIDDYAEKLLSDKSSVSYTVSYSHGYCPVRIGDCVRLNYRRAGLDDVKAMVKTQTIKCSSGGCEVSETAVFTKKLWK
jgi:hypothetical protein